MDWLNIRRKIRRERTQSSVLFKGSAPSPSVHLLVLARPSQKGRVMKLRAAPIKFCDEPLLGGSAKPGEGAESKALKWRNVGKRALPSHSCLVSDPKGG